MLSFLVFDGDTPHAALPLRHASLLGPESASVPGEIRFEDGLIRCEKTSGEAAALSIQVGLDGRAIAAVRGEHEELPSSLGVITLRTCLLPDREQPYLLSLELARHRLMLFLNKLEDWQLFDLPADHPTMAVFERARAVFTDALVAQRHDGEHASYGYSPEANRLATVSLILAVEASERLALCHAQREFVPRATGAIYNAIAEAAPSNSPIRRQPNSPVITPERTGVVLPGRPAVGCAVSPGSFSEPLQAAAEGTVDFVQMPVRWIEMEPDEGKYFFKPTDRWIEWAVRKARLNVFAGPVIDFRASCVPEWLYVWENDYEMLREYVYEHLKNVITRYRRTITRWTVLSGIHANENFRFSFDQMMDLTRLCVLVVRKLHPTARIFIELTHPWGEYGTANRRSLPPFVYADMVNQAGIMVDGFGLRVQMGQPRPGQSARDLMEFSAMLDRYAAVEKPIALTAVGVPSGTPEAAGSPDLAQHHPGFWRRPWSPDLQRDWASGALGIALAKPFVQSVCWQELYDLPQAPEMPRGGLLGTDTNPKPVAARFTELYNAVRAGKLPEHLSEDLLADPATANAAR